MSTEDPTDDELEREAGRDAPLASGGNRHHAPRLEAVSRAIDLREMRPILEAEREASDTRMGSEQRGASDRYQGTHGQQRMATAADYARPNQQRPGPSPLRSALRPAQAEPARPEPHPTPYSPEAQAWDRYVIAALPIVVAKEFDDPEGIAAKIADRLLEERRRRFA